MTSAQHQSRSLISVTFFLRGTELDPELVSRVLQVKPSRSQRRGGPVGGAASGAVPRKTGFWAIDSTSKSGQLADHLDEVISAIPFDKKSVGALPGLERVELAIFLSEPAETDGGGTCHFELSSERVAAIEKLGAPVSFEVAIVNKGRPGVYPQDSAPA